MQKGGTAPLKDEEIFEAIDLAEKNWKELFNAMNKFIGHSSSQKLKGEAK